MTGHEPKDRALAREELSEESGAAKMREGQRRNKQKGLDHGAGAADKEPGGHPALRAVHLLFQGRHGSSLMGYYGPNFQK